MIVVIMLPQTSHVVYLSTTSGHFASENEISSRKMFEFACCKNLIIFSISSENGLGILRNDVARKMEKFGLVTFGRN